METDGTVLSNAQWAERVGAACALPDLRLNHRLSAILADTLNHPQGSIPQATGGNAGQAKGAYRFYENARVEGLVLNAGIGRETAERCLAYPVILAVQDTTSLNLTGLRVVAELGPLDGRSAARGLHLHSTLALTPLGEVLGVLDQQTWARAPRRPSTALGAAKESGKWLYGIEQARQVLYETAGDRPVPTLIHVMDREGDAYEVLMAIAEAGESAVIRSAQNRRVEDPLATAHTAIRHQPVQGRATVAVPRQGDQPERVALVEVRAMTVRLTPDRSKYPHGWAMTWNLVEVWEPGPPAGVEPLHWRLWTREPIATFEETLPVVQYYACRWKIEEFHLVLKSGCQVEKLRLETWDRLDKAIRVNSAVAARIVFLRDKARMTPEAPALAVLAEDEVAALVNHFGKKKPLLIEEVTIRQATLWIARLGGHLNRKRDGMPGVRTLWRGLQALSLLVAGFRAGRRAGNKCG
jgi:hypothetical protein